MGAVIGSMRIIPGGCFTMGSEHFYPEEAPLRLVEVDPFELDSHPVTNGQFTHFVKETGWVTGAEATGGSLLFDRHDRQAAPRWKFVEGVSWRHPLGPDSSINDIKCHPVVHVDPRDAGAYAAWSGKRLPTEAEWEWAARGGLAGLDYAWGNERQIDGMTPANIWIGIFPHARLGGLALPLTTRVGAYACNGFGLHDLIGNVWEITSDEQVSEARGSSCCSRNPTTKAHVIKGGSFLCADNHCRRYRPAARQFASEPASHIGFRCAR